MVIQETWLAHVMSWSVNSEQVDKQHVQWKLKMQHKLKHVAIKKYDLYMDNSKGPTSEVEPLADSQSSFS